MTSLNTPTSTTNTSFDTACINTPHSESDVPADQMENRSSPLEEDTSSLPSELILTLPLASLVDKQSLSPNANSSEKSKSPSSTDTTLSFGNFDSNKDNVSSADSQTDGEYTKADKQERVSSDQAILQPPLPDDVKPLSTSTPVRELKAKRSFWNIIRGSTSSIQSSTTAVTSELSKDEQVGEIPEAKDTNPVLQKRRSFHPFPNLNVGWTSSHSRRHTIAALVDETNFVPIKGALGTERSLDGSVHLPSIMNESRLADDAVRFADARHVIKTEQDVEIIRMLANRLEQGWREKQCELSEICAKLGEAHLQLHDLRDENRHLRSQLGNMSEQIVTRDNDIEQLQRMAVEQSKKEKQLWEEEKRQEMETLQLKWKEAQRKIVQMRLLENGCYESDEEQEEQDMVLFSANTSIDGDPFYRQSKVASVDIPLFNTPTTPTLQTKSDSYSWRKEFARLSIDPLHYRLEALQAAQNRTIKV